MIRTLCLIMAYTALSLGTYSVGADCKSWSHGKAAPKNNAACQDACNELIDTPGNKEYSQVKAGPDFYKTGDVRGTVYYYCQCCTT